MRAKIAHLVFPLANPRRPEIPFLSTVTGEWIDGPRLDAEYWYHNLRRTVRFAEASASGASVLAGRKNKGAHAYRELASALLKHWKNGKALATFTPEL